VLHAFTHLYGVALLPLYLRIQADLNLAGVEQATLLVTVMGLAYFLPSYPLGVLADRLSRKKLLATGLAINAAGFVGLAFAPGFGWSMAAVIIAGFGGSFYHPCATALIAKLFPEARGRALGLLGVGASIGFFLGPLYTGWRVMSAESWRVPVLELGVLGVVAAIAFAWFAKEETDRAGETGPSVVDKPLRMFPTVTVWILFVGMSLLFSLRDFAGSAMGTTASLFLQWAHGFNPKFTGTALAGLFLMSAVSNPLFGHLSDRGRLRWILLVLVCAALLINLFPRVPGTWAVPVLFAYGFFFMACYPMTEAALMDAVPDAVRGRVIGLFITLAGVVANISHWVSGKWVERLGQDAALASHYYPWFAALSGMIMASLLGLPLLYALARKTGSSNK